MSGRDGRSLDKAVGPSLRSDLEKEVRGEVRFDTGARAMYSTDASNYRHVPLGVVAPLDASDVEAALAVARRWGAAVLPRGGGTSLAGQACNRALVIDCSRFMRQVAEIDPARRRARVLPGTVLDDLRRAARDHGLTFGPDPATHDRCTLGGMIGNNSCGVHSIIAGRTVDNVESLEVLTYDGLRLTVGPTSEEELQAIVAGGGRRAELYQGMKNLVDHCAPLIRSRFPQIPRRVSGYNLDELLPERGFNVARALVGTEGTCATVLSAEVKLVEIPEHRALAVLGYPDVVAAADAVPAVMAEGPIGLEGFDDRLVSYERRGGGRGSAGLDLLPEGAGWLLAEVGGSTPAEASEAAHRLAAAVTGGSRWPSVTLVGDPEGQERIWSVREAALGVTTFPPGEAPRWGGWEDAAVAPERLGDYLRGLRRLEEERGYAGSVYGHFGHGCIHTRIDFDLTTAAGIATFRSFVEEAADLVAGLGGSLSGEHGDGQARAELLDRMFGPDLVQAFARFKDIWDPEGRMNPGKVVRPAPLDQDLRLGPTYRPVPVRTYFSYPRDGNRFHRAALRCVGVGKCRRREGGAMCPSYLVTGKEEDSTRGRARLLFEMLQGDVVADGWRSKAVLDALDLCLACKSCRAECPVGVDMATYKAEFLAHHYRGRPRPPAHYSMGWLPAWSLLASRAPRVLNLVGATPGLGGLVKRAGGIARERPLPRYARQTLRDWAANQGLVADHPGNGPSVLLWPDTFNNYFHPEVGRAAASVLRSAGLAVSLPRQALCCGLTWVSTGQLGVARRVLSRTVDALSPWLSAGTPVVVLEPSCAAMLRSDGPELLGADEGAKRLAGLTMTLGEALGRLAPGWNPPPRSGTALVQYHCHQRAVLTMGAEEALLARSGLDVDVVPPTCCGLAGNFGFEAGHYAVSMAVAQRDLLPAVERAGPGALLVADGFSCRTQIEQATGQRVLHLAEVLDPGMGASRGAQAVSGDEEPWYARGGQQDRHRILS